ncbi:class I SAM-dependent methyltransferase [Psychromonas hadalis]|uniref:class I SAM-dependent methyltransferase n=1 Tax=Psychromonas hadalis TaxID=211669 RepID=UPI0003B43504|nr:SAM-dependent methyltransferase [Psychromonas hadalis]
MKLDRNAMGLAFLRGVESSFHQDVRFFEDRYALKLIPGAGFKLAAGLTKFHYFRKKIINRYEKSIPGVYGNMICRTRYIDEKLNEAIQKGVKNVVILGAGMDMRAFRIEGIDSLHIYELDSAAMSDYKQQNIKSLIGDNQHVTYVPINLKTESLQQYLTDAGCDNSLQTLFIWEGQTQYFSQTQVEAMLKTVANFAKGSQLIFSYLIKDVIPEYSQEEIEENLVKWQFGIEPKKVKAFLAENKLQLVEDVNATEFEKRYIEPSERALSCLVTEHTVLVEV